MFTRRERMWKNIFYPENTPFFYIFVLRVGWQRRKLKWVYAHVTSV